MNKEEKMLIIPILSAITVFCLLIAKGSLPDAVYVSIIPLILSGIISKKALSVQELFCSKKRSNIVFSIVLSIVFFLMLNLAEIFRGSFFYKGNVLIDFLGKIFQFSIYPVMLLISLYIILLKIFKFTGITENSENKKILRYIYPQTIVIACIAVLFIAGGFPFISYSDARVVRYWAQNAYWDEWHTIGYLLFVRICYLIHSSPFVVTVIQTIVWIFINNKAFDVIYKYTNSKKICNIYLWASLIFFTPHFYLIMTVKDVPFSMCLFAAGIWITDILFSPKVKISSAVMLTVFASLASIFRHGSIIPIIVSLGALWIYFMFKNRRKAIKVYIPAAVTIIFYLFINSIISSNVLHAVPNPEFVTYTTPVQMLGAVINSDAPLTQNEKEELESIMPLPEWENRYNKYWSDPLTRDYYNAYIIKLNESHYQRLVLKLNFQFLLKYPGPYLEGMSDISSIVWEIGRPFDGYEWTPVNGSSEAEAQGAWSTVQQTASTNIIYKIARMTYDTPILRSFFWRGGIWLFLMIIIICLILHHHLYKLLIPIIPSVLVTAMLFLSIPSPDPRYILPCLEFSLFFFILIIFIRKKEISENG